MKDSCQGYEEMEESVRWSLAFFSSVSDPFLQGGWEKKEIEKKTREQETIDGEVFSDCELDSTHLVDTGGSCKKRSRAE